VSFITDILNVGKKAVGFLTGGGVGSQLARTALTGFLLNKATKSITSGNRATRNQVESKPIDRSIRIQLKPDAEHKIPVIYGNAVLEGIITDAHIANNNTTMYYVVTICEKTGTKISDDTASAFTFQNIYWNDSRVVFDSDGTSVNYVSDREGNIDYSLQDLVEIYCFAGSSTDPVVPDGYTNGSLANAYDIIPTWDSTYTMSDLIFAVIKVNYNAERAAIELGDIAFKLTNSMTMPGDCIHDYMTNTRYGAGIDPAEIYDE